MFNAEFFHISGALLERVVLGRFSSVIEADNVAKSLFEGMQLRHPGAACYRVLNNAGTEVARGGLVHS
jgi:hypothetical protein